MRVVVVGGVERTERMLQDAATELGHELEFHGGHMDGRGAGGLRSAVDRADLVIVVTDEGEACLLYTSPSPRD